MCLNIAQSKIEGKKLTAIFSDESKKPNTNVHLGVVGYVDQTVAPHDAERRKRYIERHKTSEDWADGMTVEHDPDISYANSVALNTGINRYYKQICSEQSMLNIAICLQRQRLLDYHLQH